MGRKSGEGNLRAVIPYHFQILSGSRKAEYQAGLGSGRGRIASPMNGAQLREIVARSLFLLVR